MRRFILGAALVIGAPTPVGAWTFDWAGHVEIDAEGLRSEDPTKRLEAVSELGKYDLALTEKHLLRALVDADEKVRFQAARTLGQGGSTTAVPSLIDWLNDPDVKTKTTAAEALGEIGGPDAIAALTRSLGDTDAGVRTKAVKALGTIGRKGSSSVVIALIPRLEDEKSEVRAATILELEELGDRRAVIPLVAKFSDTQPETRKAAVRAVGKLGDSSAVPALIRLMNDPQQEVKTVAVGALGSLGAVDAIDALTEQLSTGNDAYRSKVAYALAQIAATPAAGKAGEAAMRTLVTNLAQPQLKPASKEALRIAGRAAVPALIANLQGRIAGDPASAVAALIDAGDPRATPTLAAELERGRVAMPIVLRALGATGDPAALVPLLGALSSKDAAIRITALEAMRPLIGTDARAGDVLIEHLADDELEVRVLAAEYLGLLRVAAAGPKLAAIAGPGHPSRLRRAAIDSLGEIGRSVATGTLLAVLREGPSELHHPAATALSMIADPAAIPMLVAQAKTDLGPARAEVVRALGATLRGHDDAGARTLLRQLAQGGTIKVSLSAIGGLAVSAQPSDAAFLKTMVVEAAADRQRAAAWALGEMRDVGSVKTLAAALSVSQDRLVGTAAWALGEILAASPRDGQVSAIAQRWLHLAKFGGWSSSINSTAGLARVLWALPRDARGQLLDGTRRSALFALVFHKSRLVKINAAHALASLTGDDDAASALVKLLRDDASPQVRIAAARALSRLGGPKAMPALRAAQSGDRDLTVKTAVNLAIAGLGPPPVRDRWVVYYIVDPSAGDAPVRQEQYFVHTTDDLVWATYTDARGYVTSEHVPSGDAAVWPARREAGY